MPSPETGAQGEAVNQEGTAFSPRVTVGVSPTFQEAIGLARRMAAFGTAPVLLNGEPGTGKALVARGIHSLGSTAGGPCVVVNCAGLPEPLLEAELFGSEHGSLAGATEPQRGLLELAGTGSVLLAEISEMPQRLQVQLLRALEERRYRRPGGFSEVGVTCRIIATSKVSLDQAVSSGSFREDLFLLLSACQVKLPPLRLRSGDVPLLARHFLAHWAHQHGGGEKQLCDEAIAALEAQRWPGNVRELKLTIERAAILADEATIRPHHLTIQHRTSRPVSSSGSHAAAEIQIPPWGKTLEEVEHEALLLTLQLTRGNRSAAARLLGISRPTLARKLRAGSRAGQQGT